MSSEFKSKIIFVVAVLVVIAGTALWGSKGSVSSLGNGGSAWYTVYLNNDQIYFGHIMKLDDTTITLSDVHYVEQVDVPAEKSTSENFAVEQAPKQTLRVTEKGSDTILTSDHTLYLNRSSVAYWEKLSPDAEVAKLLEGQSGI